MELTSPRQKKLAMNAFMEGLTEYMQPYLKRALEGVTEELKTFVAQTIESRAKRIEIVEQNGAITDVRDLGVQHKAFPTLLSICQARTTNGHLNVWLVGPAGSGKTTAASMVAKALKMAFYFTGAIDNPYGLMGFIDAKGAVVRTPFREAYENGGVFLLDDFDSSSPSAALALQAALANGVAAFPDRIVERHPTTIILVGANTFGLGATTDYVGRTKQDAAFLDRFVQVNWEYDNELEATIANNKEWVKRVQKIRAAVKAKGLKVVISPRASQFGAALLAAGMEQSEVETICLRKAMTNEQWESVSC